MADISPKPTWTRQSQQSVEVGAIDVDLTPSSVDGLANFGNGVFEHPVSGRVGDHRSSQGLAILSDLCVQIGQVNRPVRSGGNHHDLHAGHHRRGGIRAMG